MGTSGQNGQTTFEVVVDFYWIFGSLRGKHKLQLPFITHTA
jgi:hypothetical protein